MGTHTFIRDHVATVNATPGDGFSHWESDAGEESIPARMMVIELDESKSPTAGGRGRTRAGNTG